ncbi:MAG: hypothetical protein Q8L39_04990 [Burkholderiales bacterium]|nr:hypothetical protein [Burkholderiales bacterium]
MSFRKIRIILLLLILAMVAGITYWESMLVRSWLRPLEVSIYAVNGDGSDISAAYIAQLSDESFQEIAAFFDQQAARHRLKKLPHARIQLAGEIRQAPPAPPSGERGVLNSLLWSLQMRYYAFHTTPFWENMGRIRLFVVYHEGEEGKPLQHSLGLRKGLVGVVHVFAKTEQSAQNNIVITHELLHTLGASDKYDAQGQPVYPDGFAHPDDGERYPQHSAEIMAGRIAVRPDRAIIPANLDACAVGPKTAYEIGW